MDRRAVLKAAPAVALAAAVPAVALGDDPAQLLEVVAPGESEIMRLFARIERMKADLDAKLDTFGDSDPAADEFGAAGLAEINAVAETLMAIEPQTAVEFAMQVAYWQGENIDPDSNAGEGGAGEEVLRARIRRLVGYPAA
jgi:hypothetical protein